MVALLGRGNELITLDDVSKRYPNGTDAPATWIRNRLGRFRVSRRSSAPGSRASSVFSFVRSSPHPVACG